MNHLEVAAVITPGVRQVVRVFLIRPQRAAPQVPVVERTTIGIRQVVPVNLRPEQQLVLSLLVGAEQIIIGIHQLAPVVQVQLVTHHHQAVERINIGIVITVLVGLLRAVAVAEVGALVAFLRLQAADIITIGIHTPVLVSLQPLHVHHHLMGAVQIITGIITIVHARHTNKVQLPVVRNLPQDAVITITGIRVPVHAKLILELQHAQYHLADALQVVSGTHIHVLANLIILITNRKILTVWLTNQVKGLSV
ncbi:hypothetical protein A2714_00965 [Candidatus Woesebacteria bacterium RIFCSPHIGHO2_01_FULL_38_9]|uniref:Uncharacterized protein n=2 Tax=Candidatus Woeseibacteriota TaxID=1752722 RepID=A0A1F7XYH5_9BACT|nr:MAG: hypothetical protein A2714_00965 [Candidatus Woesebacteria bacterium RIFCSPHIGHO2_01_FULL_38_9]OGM59570.1 MAG: hypothetical protein A3A75_06020 [Candidatus Woesebacteria bacterium RIFCSPLOWO2_01_FULL_39_10]